MRLVRADRLSTVRAGARPAPARYAVPRGYDGRAAGLALGSALTGTGLVLLLALLRL